MEGPRRLQSMGSQESDAALLSLLEKEIATHPSILAWRIPWTEEPGGHSPWNRQTRPRLGD